MAPNAASMGHVAISEDKTAHMHIMSAKDFARLAEFDQKADEGEMRRQGGTGEKLVSMYDLLDIKSQFREAMLDAGVGTTAADPPKKSLKVNF